MRSGVHDVRGWGAWRALLAGDLSTVGSLVFRMLFAL